MNLAVITCAKYSDAWPAFFGLLEKFWPDHPPVDLLTDELPREAPNGVSMVFHAGKGKPWCDVLRRYADVAGGSFLLMQEDFILSAPVRKGKLAMAERGVMEIGAGCFRVFPCPGPPDVSWPFVPRGEAYRVSCQAAVWSANYLRKLLQAIPNARTAADFELMGTPASNELPQAVMSVHRHHTPWPIEYICTAIVRGKWLPDAKRLCDEHGIEVDWSRREMWPEKVSA